MTAQIFKDTLLNKMMVDSPKYLRQKLINSIVDEKIGCYGKEKDGMVSLTTKPVDQKIEECLNFNNKTIQLIDLLEIKKGYKYTILCTYESIDIEKLQEVAININSDYYNEYADIDQEQILFMEDDLHVYLKFHKYIDITIPSELVRKKVRYPILFVFHKGCNLFEIRFDKLSYNKDYDFYKITMDVRLNWVKSILGVEYEYFNLEKTIKYIVENEKDTVKELIWSFETARSKGLTLKVGEDGVMPFVGDLENLLNSLAEQYSEETAASECLKVIKDYLSETKRFANEKFRLLSWVKKEVSGQIDELDNPIDLKIIFNYSERMADLVNIYDNEINDMERIDYVIRFIGKIAEDIGEL